MKTKLIIIASCLFIILFLASEGCKGGNSSSSTPYNNLSKSTSNTQNNSTGATTLMLSDVNTNYNYSVQNITLSATVSSSNSQVNVGAVTFTVQDNKGNILGVPVTGNVTNGGASAVYNLPGGTIPSEYNINGNYKGNNYKSSNGGANLIVNKTSTSTAVESQNLTYSGSGQNFTLVATVSAAGSIVNEGKITFTVKDSHGNPVGSQVWGLVTNGGTKAAYSLPGGSNAATYSIEGDYTAENLENSKGMTSLTVNPAPTTITETNTSGDGASMTFTFTVTSPAGTVNEGQVTFVTLNTGLVWFYNINVPAPAPIAVKGGIATVTLNGNTKDPNFNTGMHSSINWTYSDNGGNFKTSNGGGGD
jgi:hypothetical protein